MASDTIIAHGKEYDASPLSVENWTAGKGEIDFHFKNKVRAKPLVSEIIVHETVTCSSLSTVKVLEPASPSNPGGRGLGVHFIVDPSGLVYQHADLADETMWHATMHNEVSIGIETTNPVDPRYMPKNGPWSTIIDAPWAGGKYVVPTKEEAEAVANILGWCIKDGCPPELQIPLTFIGLTDGKMTLGRVQGATNLVPGIYAHHYFDHGDGAWLVLYSWLRLVASMDPDTAYDEAIKRATGVHIGGGADVSDLLPKADDENPYA